MSRNLSGGFGDAALRGRRRVWRLPRDAAGRAGRLGPGAWGQRVPGPGAGHRATADAGRDRHGKRDRRHAGGGAGPGYGPPARGARAGGNRRAEETARRRRRQARRPGRGRAAVRAAEPAPNPGWSGVDKTWPSGNATATTPPPPVTTLPVVEPPAAASAASGPPPRVFEELVVSADSVLGLQLDSTVSSEVAKVEDPVNARVTRDVKVGAGHRDSGGHEGARLGDAGRARRQDEGQGARRRAVPHAGDGRRHAPGDQHRRDSSAKASRPARRARPRSARPRWAARFSAPSSAAARARRSAARSARRAARAAVMAGGRNPAVLNAGTSVTVRLQQPVYGDRSNAARNSSPGSGRFTRSDPTQQQNREPHGPALESGPVRLSERQMRATVTRLENAASSTEPETPTAIHPVRSAT